MKKVFKILLIALFGFWALCPLHAHAQAPGGSKQASAGTLMAAVMEQVGYHAQSKVLADLGEKIEWAAALIYLGVLVSILITVGLMGNYKAALWILVGPPMFVYMSGIEMGGQKNTTKGAKVEWRFGAFKDKQTGDDQGKMLKDSEVGKDTTAEVSFFFHKYNELISEVFQELISIITSEDTRTQMMFMARQRMMEELFSQQVQTPGLISLGQFFMVNCSREIAYAQYVALGLRDPEKRKDPNWEVSRDEYCRMFTEKKPFPPGAWQDYLYSEKIYKGLHISKQQNEGEKRLKEDGVITCQLLWEGLMHGAKESIYTATEGGASTAILPQAWRVSGHRTFNEVMNEIKKKLTDANENVTTEKKDKESIDCISGKSNAGNVNSDVEIVTNIMSAYLLKKVMVSTPYANMITRVSDRDHTVMADQTIPLGTNPQVKEAILRRQGAHQYSESRRFEALTLITVLPYLQGMILYVLAVTYPFFCLMLILPGQAGAFLTWMALWAWAKSWDVGWALVMIADEVLWELMPKTAFIDAAEAIDQNNPVSMLEIAFDGDHSYNTATYWLLVSGMVSGVPVIMANAVLGAKKAVSGVLLQGFTSIADPFSQGAADWVAGQQVRGHTTRRERASNAMLQKDSLGRMTQQLNENRMMNDKSGKGLLSEGLNPNGGAEQDKLMQQQYQAEEKRLQDQIAAESEPGGS